MEEIMMEQMELMMSKMMTQPQVSPSPNSDNSPSLGAEESLESEEDSGLFDSYEEEDDDFFSDDADSYDSEPAPQQSFNTDVASLSSQNSESTSKQNLNISSDISSPAGTPNIEMTSSSKTVDISSRGQRTVTLNQAQNTDYAQDPVYQAQQETINKLLEQQKLYTQQLESALGKIQELQSFMQSSEQQSCNNKAKQEVFNTKQPFENVISEPCTNNFMGQPFTYRRYEEEVKFDKRFERGMSDEDTARNYLDFVDKITDDIESKFGGWDRITNMAVVSNLLIINGVSYEPYLPEYYQEMLPFDVRNNLSDGQFAWLFNFNTLRKMKNLVNLKFDSSDFVFSKVRKDLGVAVDFEPGTFFKICKRLQNLQIGEYVVTASNPDEHNNVFHRASRSEKIYNACLDLGVGKTKMGWNSIKNVFHDPNRSGLSKVWGITWRGTATAVAGAGTIGVKATGLAAKIGKSAINFASSIKNNLK